MKLLSIIIPTLNEVKYLQATVNALNENARSCISREVIILDSGSVDGTQDLARELSLRVINYTSESIGKADALNYGAYQAKGDVLLFLDADSVAPVGYDQSIQKVLESPGVIGGAFEFALSGSEFGLRIVEWMNRLRYRIWPRYYGDQGIFVRRRIFEDSGGFPNKALLEASHLCMRLRKKGELYLIKHKMYTSPRRFLEGGIFQVLGSDFKIWYLDLMGFSTEKFAGHYWNHNQMRGKSIAVSNIT